MSTAEASKEQKAAENREELFKDDEDEFEEFESFTGDSTAVKGQPDNAKKADINVWEDNWDDETAETDFSKQLRQVI